MNLTILFLASEGHKRAVYLGIKLVVSDVKQIILQYLMSLGLQRALSKDKVVRDMKPTIILYLLPLGLQKALNLGIKLSGT